jgi:hypothetical protein
VVDHLAVPDRLEDPVREAQDEHVLDRLLAEVVVDPVDLALVEVAPKESVQLAGARGVGAERLLDDQPDPSRGGAVLADLLDRRLHRRRRDREVVDAVSLRAMGHVELGETLHDRLLATLVSSVGT